METYGIGGFAMACAPAIVRFVGGSAALAQEKTRSMYEITLAESPHLQIAPMDFRGSPTGIDATRVVVHRAGPGGQHRDGRPGGRHRPGRGGPGRPADGLLRAGGRGPGRRRPSQRVGPAMTVEPPVTPESVRALFDPAPGLHYLDTATYGLPPRPTMQAMTEALAAWRTGTAYWIDWDVVAERARTDFATLVGVPPPSVALVPAASVAVGTVAASLTAEDRVVVPDDEFTSLLFPLLVAAERGTDVRQVPWRDLVSAIEPGTTLVATSLVQMQTGRVAPLEALLDRAAEVGARLLVDATHGLPFVGMGGVLARVDYVAVAAYKHLLCPRGVGFLIVRDDRQDGLAPWNANWRAASDPYGRYVGGPLDLTGGAGRFDVSVAWHPWIGGAVSLELLTGWAGAGLLDRALALAAGLADRLGVDHGGSSIVCAPVRDVDRARAALDGAGVKAGFREGGVRLSTHVYSTDDDLDAAVEAVAPLLT